MTQENRKALWDELTAAGVQFDKHYRDYSEKQLQAAVDHLHAKQAAKAAEPEPQIIFPDDDDIPDSIIPSTNEHAGMAGTTADLNEPIRTEPDGIVWYQDEVRKPPYPKPRGRRVVRYVDPGVTVQESRKADGSFETFEMPGTGNRVSEVKVTLPSYQTGIYKDPRFPFKIHVYNDERAFDRDDVEEFYGGRDLVPNDIAPKYISNDLCYDIRTTIRAIEAEARELELRKAI